MFGCEGSRIFIYIYRNIYIYIYMACFRLPILAKLSHCSGPPTPNEQIAESTVVRVTYLYLWSINLRFVHACLGNFGEKPNCPDRPSRNRRLGSIEARDKPRTRAQFLVLHGFEVCGSQKTIGMTHHVIQVLYRLVPKRAPRSEVRCGARVSATMCMKTIKKRGAMFRRFCDDKVTVYRFFRKNVVLRY